MNYTQLRLQMRNRLVFRGGDLHQGRRPPAHESVQFSHWVRKKKLIRLKRGLYTLPSEEHQNPLSAVDLAEPLYRPSYLSLAWALSAYGLIPEAVGPLTSLTTLKTARFTNPFGTFLYHHIHPKYFFGFTRPEGKHPHWMALPEKALLDFVHIAVPKGEPLNTRLFKEGYRFQNLKTLNAERLRSFARRFARPRVQESARLFLQEMRGRS